MALTAINSLAVKPKLESSLYEVNPFWWGVVIGKTASGKIERVRVTEKEEVNEEDFTPIVKVKYSKHAGEKGKIIKWY